MQEEIVQKACFSPFYSLEYFLNYLFGYFLGYFLGYLAENIRNFLEEFSIYILKFFPVLFFACLAAVKISSLRNRGK